MIGFSLASRIAAKVNPIHQLLSFHLFLLIMRVLATSTHTPPTHTPTHSVSGFVLFICGTIFFVHCVCCYFAEDSFMHLFTLEALAVARAHVAAIGRNTLLNYRLNDCVLIEHPHKNQVSLGREGGRSHSLTIHVWTGHPSLFVQLTCIQ